MDKKIKHSILLVICIVLFPLGVSGFTVISSEGKSLKWSDNKVEYYINERGSDDFEGGFDGAGSNFSEFEALNNSFTTWQSVSSTDLAITFSGLTPIAETKIDEKNVIFWIEKGWNALDFHPPRGALAVTISSFDVKSGEIIDTDILLNGEYFKWANIDSEDESMIVDIENTVTHEVGHVLGLDHSSNDPFEENEKIRTATMYYATNPGITLGRSLESDDILGLQHLYPANVDAIPRPDIDGIIPTSGDNSGFVMVTSEGGKNFTETSLVRLVPHEDDASDVIAKEVLVEGNEITSLFDLRGVKIGVYDVVVSNAYGKEAKLDNAFEVKGNPNVFYNRSKVSYIDGGGCGLLTNGRGERSRLDFGLILCCLIILLMRSKRSSEQL